MALPVKDPSKIRFSSPWRRMAAAIYARPLDGKVSGFADMDFRPSERAIAEWNAQGHRGKDRDRGK